MKSRKKIKHAELVAQVIEQTKNRGTLDMGDIKKNIDKLIEKDYMEREEGSRDVYNYVAWKVGCFARCHLGFVISGDQVALWERWL